MAITLNYGLQITGDCQNNSSGALGLTIYGGTPNYTITWLSPSLSPIILAGSATTITSLSGGSYSFYVSDQSIPVNNTNNISFYVSTGCCVSIDVQDTTCNLPNGSLTATTAYASSYGTAYLYKEGQYIASALTSFVTQDAPPPLSPVPGLLTSAYFDGLSAGTYQVTLFDYGGCQCSSQTCIIRNSSEFDFGLLVANASSCNNGYGRLTVTGNTGTGPFEYQWSPNVLNSSITASTVSGLSAGSYSVVVTDSTGCQVTKSAIINTVPPLGLNYYTATPASCLSDDGTITFNISGGTPPYYYILSNGDSAISYSNVYTFSGLAANTYTLQLVDLAICNFSQDVQVPMEGNFNVISVVTNNVTCTSYGSLSINLIGNPPFTYILEDSSGVVNTIVTQVNNYQFTNLTADTYTLTISDYLGSCEYTDTYTIEQSPDFSMEISSTGTTCNSENGTILVDIIPFNSTLFSYELQGIENSGLISDTSYLFSGLNTGVYTIIVTDENGCTQTDSIILSNQSQVDFNLYSTDCGLGSEGTVSAIINNGTPPFNLYWSASTIDGILSIGSQNGIYLTGLTSSDYYLTVTDLNGCVLTKSISVTCGNLVGSSYQVFNICEQVFTETSNQKRGIIQMYNEGYQDLTAGSNCILNYANFITEVTIGSQVYTSLFYTSYSLNDLPTDGLYIESIQSAINGAYGVGNVSIDSSMNIVLISSDCNLEYDVLQDLVIDINLKIEYDFDCQS
jgi:hypothetical protein